MIVLKNQDPIFIAFRELFIYAKLNSVEQNRLPKVLSRDLLDKRDVAGDSFAKAPVISSIFYETRMVNSELTQVKGSDVSFDLSLDLHVVKHRVSIGTFGSQEAKVRNLARLR